MISFQLPIPALAKEVHLAILLAFVPYELLILSPLIGLAIEGRIIVITASLVLLVVFGIFASPIFGVSFVGTSPILLDLMALASSRLPAGSFLSSPN